MKYKKGKSLSGHIGITPKDLYYRQKTDQSVEPPGFQKGKMGITKITRRREILPLRCFEQTGAKVGKGLS